MMSSESMAAFNAAAEQPDDDSEDPTPLPAGMVFTSESVEGILADRKTQTRRLVSPGSIRPRWNRSTWPQLDLATAWVDPGPSPAGNPGPYLKAKRTDPTAPPGDDHTTVLRLYPAHFVGDRLYVKETWQAVKLDYDYETGYCDGIEATDPARVRAFLASEQATWGGNKPLALVYDAGGKWDAHRDDRGFPWRSSMLMPRWAARIVLEVTGVRVERLQDMPWQDALREGIQPELCDCQKGWGRGPHGCTDCMDTGITENPRDEYEALWGELHREPGTTWADNPWVIVYDFKRIQPDGTTSAKTHDPGHTTPGSVPGPDEKVCATG